MPPDSGAPPGQGAAAGVVGDTGTPKTGGIEKQDEIYQTEAEPASASMATVAVEVPVALIGPLIAALEAAEMACIRRGLLGPTRGRR